MYAQREVLNQTLYLQAYKASTHLLFKQLCISLYVTVLHTESNHLSAWYHFALGIKLFSYSTPPLLRKVSLLQQCRKQHQSLQANYRQKTLQGSLRHTNPSPYTLCFQENRNSIRGPLHHQNASESTKHCKIISSTNCFGKSLACDSADLQTMDRGAFFTICTTNENTEGWGHSDNSQKLVLLAVNIYTPSACLCV